MNRARGHIEARGWSQGLLSFGINEPRTKKDNNKLMVGPEEPSFLGKALWKVGTQPPWECCTKGNQSFEKKLQ